MTSALITGARGFVGRALCEKLEANGHSLKRVVRNDIGDNHIAVGDIGSKTDWHPVLYGCDAVVHLAARVHIMDMNTDSLVEFRQINTEGTLNLARQAAQTGVRRFVFVSSVKVNGETGKYSSASLPAPQGAYAMSKWEAEQGLNEIAAETGMEVIILRTPLIYGPGVRANFLRLIQWVNKGIPLPFDAVHNRRSLLYLGNLVDAIQVCISHSNVAGKTYLLTDGAAISTSELIEYIASGLGRPARLWPLPVPLLRLLGSVIGKKTAFDRLLDSLEIDDSEFHSDTGWIPPYTMNEGIQETLQWYRSKHS